jgi:AcrR family transcriptional regulator
MSKAERTREFIIEKAAAVFNMKGYAGTSMSDLTDATGLTKGAIYGNFENKDAVALAVYDYNYGLIDSEMRTIVSGFPSYVDKLYAMAGFYRTHYAMVIARGGCPILNTAVEADDCHPALREKAAGSIRGWKRAIERIIEKGREAGEIKREADGKAFAIAFIALIEGGIMMTKATGEPENLNTCIDMIRKLIASELAS